MRKPPMVYGMDRSSPGLPLHTSDGEHGVSRLSLSSGRSAHPVSEAQCAGSTMFGVLSRKFGNGIGIDHPPAAQAVIEAVSRGVRVWSASSMPREIDAQDETPTATSGCCERSSIRPASCAVVEETAQI
jgi:hypothetical protein